MVDTHSQQDLQSRAQHLDVLVVQETPRDGDDMVVVRGHVRVQHRRHQAAGAVLHPPGAVKRCVERHQEVPVLNIRVEKKGKKRVCKWGEPTALRPVSPTALETGRLQAQIIPKKHKLHGLKVTAEKNDRHLA